MSTARLTVTTPDGVEHERRSNRYYTHALAVHITSERKWSRQGVPDSDPAQLTDWLPCDQWSIWSWHQGEINSQRAEIALRSRGGFSNLRFDALLLLPVTRSYYLKGGTGKLGRWVTAPADGRAV